MGIASSIYAGWTMGNEIADRYFPSEEEKQKRQLEREYRQALIDESEARREESAGRALSNLGKMSPTQRKAAFGLLGPRLGFEKGSDAYNAFEATLGDKDPVAVQNFLDAAVAVGAQKGSLKHLGNMFQDDPEAALNAMFEFSKANRENKEAEQKLLGELAKIGQDDRRLRSYERRTDIYARSQEAGIARGERQLDINEKKTAAQMQKWLAQQKNDSIRALADVTKATRTPLEAPVLDEGVVDTLLQDIGIGNAPSVAGAVQSDAGQPQSQAEQTMLNALNQAPPGASIQMGKPDIAGSIAKGVAIGAGAAGTAGGAGATGAAGSTGAFAGTAPAGAAGVAAPATAAPATAAAGAAQGTLAPTAPATAEAQMQLLLQQQQAQQAQQAAQKAPAEKGGGGLPGMGGGSGGKEKQAPAGPMVKEMPVEVIQPPSVGSLAEAGMSRLRALSEKAKTAGLSLQELTIYKALYNIYKKATGDDVAEDETDE